jgi:mono/diheme cytochrome c family protein
MFLTEFFGRLHPLLVHLPIGILLFAFALILWERFQKVEVGPAISFALLSGSGSAVLSCIAGWLLAQSGEYDADLVFQHRWMGILTAVSGFAAFFIKRIRDILTTVTVCILMITGHLGGNLTHGEDYLFPKRKTVPEKVISPMDSTAGEALAVINSSPAPSKSAAIGLKPHFLFRDEVMPVLEKKCISCHSETKKKGGLRLDTEEFIRLGGENGPVISAGNPDKSPLFLYVTLPEEDDKHMPPKGKPQLTTAEINLLHRWISQGTPFQDAAANGSLPNGQEKEEADAVQESSPTFKSYVPTESVSLRDRESQILKSNIDAAAPALLEGLKQQKISVSHFGMKSNYVTINFVNVTEYRSSLLDDLLPLGNRVVHLRLSRQPVSDADIKTISNLKNITRLNLENTGITDEALSYLKNMPNLEQINLYGTRITDQGLKELAKCPQLKVVFLWQTKTTAGGMEALKKAAPHLLIETGGFKFAQPDTVNSKIID